MKGHNNGIEKRGLFVHNGRQDEAKIVPAENNKQNVIFNGPRSAFSRPLKKNEQVGLSLEKENSVAGIDRVTPQCVSSSPRMNHQANAVTPAEQKNTQNRWSKEWQVSSWNTQPSVYMGSKGCNAMVGIQTEVPPTNATVGKSTEHLAVLVKKERGKSDESEDDPKARGSIHGTGDFLPKKEVDMKGLVNGHADEVIKPYPTTSFAISRLYKHSPTLGALHDVEGCATRSTTGATLRPRKQQKYGNASNGVRQKDNTVRDSSPKAPCKRLKSLDVRSKGKKEKMKVTAAVVVGTPSATSSANLLFSQRYSDVQIQCGDKALIPGHKNILGAASPVLDSLFQKKSWLNKVHIPYPRKVVMSLLSLLYQGWLHHNVLVDHLDEFEAIAQTYELDTLQQLVDQEKSSSVWGNKYIPPNVSYSSATLPPLMWQVPPSGLFE